MKNADKYYADMQKRFAEDRERSKKKAECKAFCTHMSINKGLIINPSEGHLGRSIAFYNRHQPLSKRYYG